MKKKDEKETREVTEAKSVGAYAQLTGFHRAVPIILIALAVFVTVCFVTKEQTGSFGIAVSDTLTGLFSIGGYFIPVFFLIHAFFYPTDIQKKSLIARVLSTVVLLLIISAFVEAIGTWNQHPSFDAKAAWDNGKRCAGGGMVGAAVAFGLVAVIGYIGFAILAVTAVAIYFTYFLAGEHNPIRNFFRKIAFNVFSFFARVEKKVKGDKEDKAKAKKVDKKIKAQIKKDDKDKGKRQREQKRVNTLNEREGELFEDEFFEVDNGLKELKINELGITESRSDVDIELNPTLQNKVRHDAPAAEERTAPREEKRIMNDPVEFIKRAPQRTENEDGAARSYSRSLEESADSVFADGSFTIDFAKAEKIAAKQSTMGPAIQQNRETAEVASEKVFTEKQIDEARRRDFELRKAELKRQRELEEEERRRAEAFRATTVEFDINPAYAPKAEPTYAPYTPKAEPVYTSYEPKAEPVYTSYEPKAEPIAEEPKYIPTRIKEAPCSASYSAPEEHMAYAPEAEPAAPAYTESYADTQFVSEYEDVSEENDDSYEISVDNGANTESIYTGSKFEIDFEDDEDEDYGPVFSGTEDVPVSDVTAEFDFDDDEGEVEEIPPELRNPEIDQYRKMFNIFDEDEEEKEEDSKPTFNSADSFVAKVSETAAEKEDKNLYSYGEEDESLADVSDEEPPFEIEEEPEKPKAPDYSNFKFPPIDILKKGMEEEDPSVEEEIAENGDKLIDSLAQFDVRASIKSVDRGPRITRYEIVPARGVRVSRVIGLFDDIALNLAAEGIRMEAPIPGKSAIGVEIPNRHPSTVYLRDLMESDEFMSEPSKTFACFGKDVTGNPVFGDIAKMPHILIAGATGMGKSVCINSILVSILYRARPDEVKFIMIDPKTVEFTMYNGIPHLLVPVVTDAKQAAGALMWAIDEMNRRYEIMAKHEVRKLDSYNDLVRENPSIGEPLPKIIIVIDELNDLMQQVRKPVEGLITSITQKARAAGIHMIIGTQRPSVDVITGVIKANVPSRVSCKVTSLTDSRTILDQSGAEKLLDKGDMLFAPVGKPKPLRIQGALVLDAEVDKIMKFLKSNVNGAVYDEKALDEMNRAAAKCTKGKDDDDVDDERSSEEGTGYLGDKQFLEAVDLAIKQGKISTSLIQRKISVGYGKAAKFIDIMEDLGVVSEPNGQKPRDVLVTKSEWEEMLARRSFDD